MHELAKHLTQAASERLVALFGSTPEDIALLPASAEIEVHATAAEQGSADPYGDLEPIAIIGMDGRYPHSANLNEFWENLKQARDLVDLAPTERWRDEEFDPDPAAAEDGKIYCKWGGFLADHDTFDPHFFGISIDEARAMDPQERLFLQSVWSALEDAGYTRSALKERFPKGRSADVGVFVGVTTNSYHLWAPEEQNRGNTVSPTSMPWSIANRVSYIFDFAGPSLPIDTACSSSLVAVHLACESLRQGACQLAIAGGVNLYLHPAKYQSMCRRRMLALDGKCHSYGDGGDGFVPGEGIGTLVLKPLRKAIEHGDRIQAVIRATASDHSGRSNGYSAPNPNSQASLIGNILKKTHIDPETIGYIEGHGTGTQLGDSIEVAALTRAFHTYTQKKNFCPIGCVKSNVGHAESAAGMASLAKVVLQIKHRQLVPSLHSDKVNPNIEFAESPFYLQHQLAEWPSSPLYPRRALINSFGAGGVNACAIVEEYQPLDSPLHLQPAGPCVFVISAKNEERLTNYVAQFRSFLESRQDLDLACLCYTLHLGREAMEERLAIVVSSLKELAESLGAWSTGGSPTGVYRGSPDSRRGSRPPRSKPSSDTHSLTDLASLWTSGVEVDWESLYRQNNVHRIALPVYPFAREKYWISDSTFSPTTAPLHAPLHPLIDYNCSTLKEISFASSLSESAFYAVDHRVHGQKVFPGAGFLELACIAGNLAGEGKVRQIKDVAWVQPVLFGEGSSILRTCLQPARNSVEYRISSFNDSGEFVLHSEGNLVFSNEMTDPADPEERISIDVLKGRCLRREDGAAYYRKFGQSGLQYGALVPDHTGNLHRRILRTLQVEDSAASQKRLLPVPSSSKPDGWSPADCRRIDRNARAGITLSAICARRTQYCLSPTRDLLRACGVRPDP